MSSTNKTENYGLSQFIASDKPAWLVDYNADMNKIDAGMEENKQGVEGNGTKINQIETNLEQVTQTVQNHGTTLQEYGTTLTQHTTLIGNNSQNISQLQGSVDALEELVDERENDIWVFIAGTDGIGVKDGTWKTSWIGYAMEYINRPDTRVVVLTNQGAGMVQTGLSGQNFLGMLQNSNIANKNLVTKIFIGSNNADNLGITNYNTYWLNFMTYCRTNFPKAKVEFLGYWYNFEPLPNANANSIMGYNNWLGDLQTTGIGVNQTWNNHIYNTDWFNGKIYTDAGQHAIGKFISNYLLTNTFFPTSYYKVYTQNEILTPATGITLQTGSRIQIQYEGNYLYQNVDLYINNANSATQDLILGTSLVKEYSRILNIDVTIEIPTNKSMAEEGNIYISSADGLLHISAYGNEGIPTGTFKVTENTRILIRP